MKCQICGNSEIVNDTAQGVNICTTCGNIVESNAMVSELQFTNSKASGYFLNLKTGQAGIFAGRRGPNTDTRGLRLAKGYKVVEGIASKL